MTKKILFTVITLLLAIAISAGTMVYALNSNSDAIKSVTYEYEGDKIVFTVVTKADNYNRVKITTADNLSGSLGTANSYTVDVDGNYVWKIKLASPDSTTIYAFDVRNGVTGKYLKSYYTTEVEIVDTSVIKSAMYDIVDEKIIFTVVTSAGNYSRMKVTTTDELGGSLGVANTYKVDCDGNYVWTIKAPAPDVTTNYAFDVRNAVTGKYIKEYYTTEIVIGEAELFRLATYEIINEKIVFTVITSPGDYNRIKVTTTDSLSSSLGVGTYKVDKNGNYVWTVKAAVPTESTTYAFDLRCASTNKYLKEYYTVNVEVIEDVELYKSVSYEIVDEKIVFTVVTTPGKYNRMKVTTSDNLGGSLGVGTYKVDASGDYVWTIQAAAPDKTTTYAFDLRVASTNKYLKDYHTTDVEIQVEETIPEVVITEPTLKANTISAVAGETVKVAIDIVNNPGIAGAVFTLNFDDDLVLSSVTNGEAFSYLQFTAPGKLETPCRVMWDSESGETVENGTVVYLTFELPVNAKSGDVFEYGCSYRDGDVFNNNWDDVTLDVIGGKIIIK